MAITVDFTIKRNDAGRILSGHFEEADGARPNLTGSTSRKLFARNLSTNEMKIAGANFQFSDAVQAEWYYELQAADVDTSGSYQVEFQVTRAGHKDTFPTDRDRPYMILLVQDDLGE